MRAIVSPEPRPSIPRAARRPAWPRLESTPEGASGSLRPVKIRAVLRLGSLPLLSLAACSIYDASLLGSGGAASTSGPGATSASATSSSGMGGDMSTGAGGAKPCTKASECAGVDDACQTRACNGGFCGADFATAGKVLAAQTLKDCVTVVCDGAGATKSIPDDADKPDDANDCTDDTCTAGIAAHPPKAVGAACTMGGGKRCSSASTCVECVADADCASQVCDTMTSTCALMVCGDNKKNGSETDVDCGGTQCPPCAAGKACATNADCVGAACVGLVCAATCTDGVKNGTETDVDCGGSCAAKCDVTKGCSAGADCKTGSCVAQACACANDHLVLSEIRSRGLGGAADEFIEIYNPTAADVVLDSTWKIEARSSTATTYGAARWFGTGKTIGAHKHFLVANTGYAQAPAKDEATTTAGITDATSVRLMHGTTIVDAVCYGFSVATKNDLLAAGYTCEGAPADNQPHSNTTGVGDANVSIERRPGGALGNCIDTGDNAADFITTTPAAPQNATSAATP